MRWTELTLSPAAFAIKAPVQWVVSPGGSPSVKATTRSVASALSGLIREGRVLSRTRPSNPSSRKRSCQRQTEVLDLPVRRMISFVPTPSADETERDFPARIAQTRTPSPYREFQPGLKC